MTGTVTLSVVAGPSVGARFVFDERATAIVGRAEDCDLQIVEDGQNPLVSRHHCLFDINPPQVRVRDVGSRNGTHVNGVEIGRRQPGLTANATARSLFREADLSDGDRVQLGETVLQVGVETAAAAPGVESAGQAALRYCTMCGREIRDDTEAEAGGGQVCGVCRRDPGAAISDLLRRAAAGRGELDDVRGYEVVRELGRGTQGVVYLARHHDTGALVALKMLSAQVAVKPDALAKFQREIDNVQVLHHPNVIGFHDAGSTGESFFFTSEYCPGGSVHDLVSRSRRVLRVDEAVPIVLQALAGLAHAHTVPLPDGSRGLVHRDVKPANILLAGTESEPVAKLADFGLAKAFDRAGLSGLTRSGTGMGTVKFMARPQLINYRYAERDVDVWAMAASLYWMLTGAFPREFPRDIDPIRVVLEEAPVPILRRDPSIPPRLAAVIDSALIDRPRIAVASAAEFAAALRDAL